MLDRGVIADKIHTQKGKRSRAKLIAIGEISTVVKANFWLKMDIGNRIVFLLSETPDYL
jgi:hypothetical protein